MREITDITTFTSEKPTVITIGTFDGVHLGHQKIIKRVVETAHKNGLLATVFTFFPHPRMIVQHDQQLKLIHTLAEKKQFLQLLGVDLLIVQPFDEAFANLSAEAFVSELLVKHLRAQKVIIGYDHHFGKNRTANIDNMRLFGEQYGFSVEEIPVQEVDEVSVSSTKIRQALNEGKVEIAEHYLGVPYSFTGKNPTIQGKGASIEVYFFDFNQDLYGQDLTIYFVKYLREERKFSSVSLLKKQIQDDETAARKAIAL